MAKARPCPASCVRCRAQQRNQRHNEDGLGQQLVEEGVDQRPSDGEGLHHQDQVPVHQGPVREDRHVRQREGVLGREAHHRDVDGDQGAAPADAALGRDRQAQHRARKADLVGRVEREAVLVPLVRPGRETGDRLEGAAAAAGGGPRSPRAALSQKRTF